MAEWLKAADCKSARVSVRWFESTPVHQPVCKFAEKTLSGVWNGAIPRVFSGMGDRREWNFPETDGHFERILRRRFSVSPILRRIVGLAREQLAFLLFPAEWELVQAEQSSRD